MDIKEIITSGKWIWFRVFIYLACSYAIIVLTVSTFCYKLIFHPPPIGYSDTDHFIETINTSDGAKIATYYRQAKRGMPTILWSHGNAEDIGYLTDLFDNFSNEGFGIYAYDYPGYGISDGTPTEKSCFTAAHTAWRELTENKKITSDKIIILGQSVGSGPASWLANKEQASSLILLSPFVSTYRVLTRIPLFPADKFKNINHIKKSQTPLLIIHGKRDKVIAQWHGRKLYKNHLGPKEFIDIKEAGHNDIHQIAGDQIIKSIRAFYFKNHTPSETATL